MGQYGTTDLKVLAAAVTFGKKTFTVVYDSLIINNQNLSTVVHYYHTVA